jgi:hypothetical protein
MCQRVLESEDERFVFRVKASSVADDRDTEEGKIDSDRDYLQEIDDLLERGDDLDDSHNMKDVESPNEYHLCRACRQKFVPDSLDRRNAQQFDFSNR